MTENSIELLATADEHLDDWIALQRECPITTPQMMELLIAASSTMNSDPMRFLSIMLATAIQRLSAR
jgi:hypothetical protein